MRPRVPQVFLAWLSVILIPVLAWADGPQDNVPDKVRPVPPPGIEVSAADREELEGLLRELSDRLATLRKSPNRAVVDLLPDVEIFYRAAHDALEYGEFFAPPEVRLAKEQVRRGLQRADQLARGESPWTAETGLVVRGYVSRIDGSVQPYGLVIPSSYDEATPVRLDVWLHGRGERVSEVVFLNQRSTQVGPVSPPRTIVLHPYGRYCNAFKFAGEVDVLEAMADVKRRYAIDDDRVAIRGFSMGGAGCWQLAVHYPDQWFAATPGAGFSETPEFLRVFQSETLQPTPWEKTLWRLYDCPGYADNLGNCPTIAYSGELDTQKQAADVMEQALHARGLTLTHLIGAQTKHSIHPEAAREIERRLASLAGSGRERVPRHVRFTTYTLRYSGSYWVTLEGLGRHWEPATVDARITDDQTIRVEAQNVTDFRLHFDAGLCPFEPREPVHVVVNGTIHTGPQPHSDRSWSFRWSARTTSAEGGAQELRKRPGLQGPIDDAFMDTFLVVRPSGTAWQTAVGAWADREAEHFVREWRRQFRGDAPVKRDADLTDDDIARANLILFGDPASNLVLQRVIDRLPIRWDKQTLTVGSRTFESAHHAPALVYPNPLNPSRYVVINSGFTYREYDYLNNARQVPRLPDWAVVDLRSPPDSRYPGRIADAGFFGERWELLGP
ncbi:MAG: prolyl oligopeptidase family serine peptidase [Pirellulaceae bacterium]